jgi:diguanylate cyclase (GGDEF)-like protein
VLRTAAELRPSPGPGTPPASPGRSASVPGRYASPANLRRRTAQAGLGCNLAGGLACAAYYVLTPNGPNRGALWSLLAASLVAAALAVSLPWSRWFGRNVPVLQSWAAVQTIIVALAAGLDGGIASPIAVLLFLPLSIGAMAFHPLEVAGHGLLSVGALWWASATNGGLDLAHVLVWSTVLLCVAAVACTAAQSMRGLTRDLHHANADLTELARTDPMTGLLNHRCFHEELGVALARRDRDGSTLALLLLDVDHFKAVNDRYGHPHGDEVLLGVADAIRASVRLGDLVGRTGGEEFAVLLPGTTLDGALVVAERIRTAIAAVEVPPGITASAGLALAPNHTTARDPLVRIADAALYAAKGSGRDRLVIAEASPPRPASPGEPRP